MTRMSNASRNRMVTNSVNAQKDSVVHVILTAARQHLALSIGIVVVVILAIVNALLPPLILARIIDGLTTSRTMSVAAIGSYFVLLALTGVTESIREGLLTVFGQRITHALRSAMMDKYRRLSIDALNGMEPGTVVSRFVGDVDTVENLFTSGIVSMFADACQIVSILIIIWFNNRGLALVLLVMLPILYWFTRRVQKGMHAAQLENRRAVSRVSGHVPETLANIRTIHCLAKERYMEARYDGYIEQSYQAMERSNYYDAIYSPVILIWNAVVVAVVMVLSASGNAHVLALFGMSAGTAVAVINYIAQIFGPVESLGMEIQTIQSAVAGVTRINEFLGMEEYRVPAADGRAADHAGAVIEMSHVTFGYDERKVISDFSMRVEEGEQVALAGRTGAGKSTIFRLLLGLYAPDAGSVRIRGMEASRIPPRMRRRLFGYVEQAFHMVPGTVREQITLYDETITQEQVERAAQIAGIHDTILSLSEGYDTPCSSELFSQGQWQLLSIARAVAAEPGLLLLDEITANLDADTELAVLDALRKASRGRTVLSISHRAEAMQDARIIEVGRPTTE